jgi:hypothetical protein
MTPVQEPKSMTRTCLALLAVLLAGCASYDSQDRFVLGEATRANIAEHAVRDVNLPNSKAVEESSGVRAVNAVKALNEGRHRELAGGAGSGAGFE